MPQTSSCVSIGVVERDLPGGECGRLYFATRFDHRVSGSLQARAADTAVEAVQLFVAGVRVSEALEDGPGVANCTGVRRKEAMKQKRTTRKRLMNYGSGDLFNFHGGFTELKDALAKEKSVPDAFIRDVYYRGGPRFGVLTKNPKTRKRNVEWGTYEKGVFHPWTRRPKTRRKKAVRRRKNISPVLALEGLSNLKSLGFFDKKRRKAKRRNADDTKLVTQALHKLFPGKTAQQLTVKRSEEHTSELQSL